MIHLFKQDSNFGNIEITNDTISKFQ